MKDVPALEKEIIQHCAPTLAGLKSAGLFNCRSNDRKMFTQAVAEVNQKLNTRGVYVEVMRWKDDFVLIYTYRKTHLAKDLQKEGVAELLMSYGYESTDVERCLKHLRTRLEDYDCFPHEIGVFLGYPIEDVQGFIRYGGRNCKSCGVWKVYCNECEAQRLFDKFEKCNQVYSQVFAQGRSITQMTVSA